MIKNNKWFTLLEMIIYFWVFAFASIFIIAAFSWGVKVNKNSNLTIQEFQNINTSYLYVKKILENANNVLLISHNNNNSWIENDITSYTIDNKYYNQHLFSLSELQNECNFISNQDYDIVAFTSKDDLDPIIIWVINNNDENGRNYYQLAIYKYYSILTEKSKILNDILNWWNWINNFIDTRWLLKTDWLNSYKCDINNWHLIPIWTKYYPDEDYDYTTTSFLKRFKVITTDVNENIKYWNGFIEILFEWESRNELRWRIKYQLLTKEL